MPNGGENRERERFQRLNDRDEARERMHRLLTLCGRNQFGPPIAAEIEQLCALVEKFCNQLDESELPAHNRVEE